MSETVDQFLRRFTQTLQSYSDSPLLDCQIILTHSLGQNREWLYAHGDHELSSSQLAEVETLIKRRADGEPIAHLTGKREFWSREFKVTADTLIPRPETELLVQTLLDRFDTSPKIVADLGTGTGAIAVSLAAERPDWEIYAVDSSDAALDVARENGSDLNNLSFCQGDWLTAELPDQLDIIVSNPPYIRDEDPHFADLRFEPRTALASGPDGLDDLRRIIADSYPRLAMNGVLLVEHGFDQQKAVVQLCESTGYGTTQCLTDLNQQPRAVVALR